MNLSLPSLLLLGAFSWPLCGAAAEPPRNWAPADVFQPLTTERIATLPAPDRPVWLAYLEASMARARLLPERDTQERAPAQPLSGPPKGARHTRGLPEGAPDAWYASDETATMADRVVAWQSVAGGWTKGIDYTIPRPPRAIDERDAWSGGTFDNNATIRELRFLARTIGAHGEAERTRPWREAFLRGLDYVFAAQYPNGGFPQIYPLAGGYHDAITFNDNAMVRVLGLLRSVARPEADFGFVPTEKRAEATRRLAKGLECVLASRIETAAGRTVWCQQHDALTLRPCAARNFEPAAAATAESATLVGFLMATPDPSPAIVAAIDDAMAWIERVALPGVEWNRMATEGVGLVAKPEAPVLWARIYEIGTDKPLFGDRDRSIHYVVTEISSERRRGYGWYGTWPEETLRKHQERRRTLGGAPAKVGVKAEP